jgi:glycosyltransferase involved in cell wall biosynthesis
MSGKKSIYFMVPYPLGKAPSQRFRFEQYFDILKEKGFTFKVSPFYSRKTWDILHYEGQVVKKGLRITASFFIRFVQLFQLVNYDFIFIHREAAPIGPAFFEWIIAKILRKKIIYDFDDAIWLPNYSEANTSFHKLKYYSKVNGIMKWATKISAGNRYLAEYASKYSDAIVINPTTIDTDNYHNPVLYRSMAVNEKVVIGWTGTHTTGKYLSFLIPVFEKLNLEFDFEFCVISNEKPDIILKNLNFIKWTKETEIEDLFRFDIGVMPLSDDQWANGKCGFKALQYMSLGVPAIASPVGINTEIIDNGENGFLCTTEEEWYQAFHYFLSDKVNRDNMHAAARNKIIQKYSVISNQQNFLNLFK